ncbi:hypothetical protein HMPREF9333_01616 [Johnsonella ignava ATCC 51276]|uniref:TRAM domain-containing protein n=1 Tax=Johnsonella ignava ATCC 51276 TaxID=679200 RepID=G5GJ76_9FIRM|nr:23S rRNA (uracil(1939)-C(5))-methyltransferase RlmD [Johnsonella ignava]EHI55201.1 hypothetical protein HMPREF9333_01616 [Johnsonella ignava ATCC 51276]
MMKKTNDSIYKKGDIIEFDIIDLSNDTEGIGKTDAFTWFVKDTVIGDRIRAVVMKCMKNYGYAKLDKVIIPSPERRKPRCPVSGPCGGCTMQEMSYSFQLKYKENKVLNNLIRIGGFKREDFICIAENETANKDIMDSDCMASENRCIFYPVIGMEYPWRYRNKAVIPVGERGQKIAAGFYAGRTHSIVEVDDCLIGIEENCKIKDTVLSFMKRCNIKPYNEKNGDGVIRHILIRKGFATGEIMVCIVINTQKLPYKEQLCTALSAIKGVESIMLNINRSKTNVIMGQKTVNIYGKNFISDYIGNIRFNISAESFYQVNPVQTNILYNKVLEFADLKGDETVWDLYCGIGTISLFLAQKAGRVYGIETVQKAVEDAGNNAFINNINNAFFITGNAEDILELWKMEMINKGGEIDKNDKMDKNDKKDKRCGKDNKSPVNITDIRDMRDIKNILDFPDIVVVDPPRKGCDIKCLEAAAAASPRKIVYVSCDSATLARDLKYLAGKGYKPVKVQAVDMFPWSGHVETVALLSKLDVDKHIDVEIKLDELDLTSAESKATYAQIKEYILEKFDLKVSTLYIAQIKKKCGIVLREHYNKSKKEKQAIPQCTLEKEEAIMDALKHFKMI